MHGIRRRNRRLITMFYLRHYNLCNVLQSRIRKARNLQIAKREELKCRIMNQRGATVQTPGNVPSHLSSLSFLEKATWKIMVRTNYPYHSASPRSPKRTPQLPGTIFHFQICAHDPHTSATVLHIDKKKRRSRIDLFAPKMFWRHFAKHFGVFF